MCKSYKVKIEKVVTKSRGFLVKGLFSKVDYNLIHSSKVGDNFLEMTCKIYMMHIFWNLNKVENLVYIFNTEFENIRRYQWLSVFIQEDEDNLLLLDAIS